MRPNIEVLRAHLAAMLTATGTVTRNGDGEWTTDPETGEVSPPSPVVAHDGPILVRPTERAARVVEAAGDVISLRTYDVALPAGVDVQLDDTITVTSAPYDAAIVGLELRVIDCPADVWQVAREVVAQSYS